MGEMLSGLPRNDLLFMVETLIPERADKERLVELIKEDESFIEAMLRDEDLFDRVMGDEEILVKISPKLFFAILLERIRRDLEKETYTRSNIWKLNSAKAGADGWSSASTNAYRTSIIRPS